jgi:hypothetical protein
MMRAMWSYLAMVAAVSCGGGSGSTGASATYAGTYSATYAGTYAVTSPPGQPGGTSTDTGTITITALSADTVQAAWQIPPNPPSGIADFTLSGNHGTADATGGMCFVGKLANGDTQTNCCTACTITFTTSTTFVQPNSGTFTGTTAAGVAYAGTYSGQWNGTKQ